MGGAAVFTVEATGKEPLSYQWRSYLSALSSTYTNIPFGTKAALVLTNIESTTRRLAVVVTDGAGLSVTSSPRAQLTAVAPVALTPGDSSVNLFTDVTLRAAAGSAGLVAFEWRFNGEPIPGAVSNRLALTNIQQAAAGAYSVIAHHTFGSSTSQVSTLTIAPFTITPAQPTASLFSDLTLALTNHLSAPVSYQWFFNGEPIAGAVTDKLRLTNIQKTNAGNYTVVFTNAFGSFTSQVATLRLTPFNSMYCFGFSWTDTHNCASSWTAPNFYQGRACNGPMWPEFLSANLGLDYVEANNYAHCGATAADVLDQVANFPPPSKPQLSLYSIWVGDSDFLRGAPPDGFGLGYLNVTNEVAWNQLIQKLISSNSNAVNRLYAKGAREIVFQNQVDYRGLPGVVSAFGTDVVGLSKLSDYITRFNLGFSHTMSTFSLSKPDLRIISVDMYSKLNDVLTNPAEYGFTKTTIGALEDATLADTSFMGPGADYVFWNSLHVTSKLNEAESKWTVEALADAVLETLQAAAEPSGLSLQMKHLRIGRDYTVQRSGDLHGWEDVLTFTAAAGTNQIAQALPKSAGSVFYRVSRSY